MAKGMSLAKRRRAFERAAATFEGLSGELWQAQGSELGPFMALVDRLGMAAESGRVAVLGEAVERGEAGQGSAGAHTWLMEWAPSLRAGGSARLVRVVDATREQRYAGLREALQGARVPVGNAACVVEEFERIRHRLNPEGAGHAMGYLLEAAETGGPRDIRALRRRLIAQFGHEGEFQGEQDRLKERMSLSQPGDDGSGLFDYRLVVDAEAKSVIEAAVGALSAPRPVEGVPDRRPSGQRRIDALLEVVRRGVASADGVPTTAKAQLFVTMPLADLVVRANAGTVLGSTEAGTLLGPETVRRLACDAGIVPVVLGGAGEVLEMGRKVRLFTDGQLRSLWLRDGGCTFPGCTVPAAWCDAHHLWHWSDGGPTDVEHAALACGRHHDLVHARGYRGRVIDGQVVWDLTRGSYDRWLAQRRSAAGDRAGGEQTAAGEQTDASDRPDAGDQSAAGERPDADELTDAGDLCEAGGVGPGLLGAEPSTAREFDVWDQPITGAGEPQPPPWRP